MILSGISYAWSSKAPAISSSILDQGASNRPNTPCGFSVRKQKPSVCMSPEFHFLMAHSKMVRRSRLTVIPHGALFIQENTPLVKTETGDNNAIASPCKALLFCCLPYPLSLLYFLLNSKKVFFFFFFLGFFFFLFKKHDGKDFVGADKKPP